MTRSNELYNKIAAFLNENNVTPAEVNHVMVLIRAQLPRANQQIIEAFLHTDALAVTDVGDPLTRIKGLIEPARNGFDIAKDKPVWQETPDEEDRPEVVFRPHSEGVYQLDAYNTGLLCKFHEKHPPKTEAFEENSGPMLRVHYGHVGGGFEIAFQPDGHSLVSLTPPFNLDSFVPVKVRVDTT
jgi:hypothetical protein